VDSALWSFHAELKGNADIRTGGPHDGGATVFGLACTTLVVAQAGVNLTLAEVIRHFGAAYRRQRVTILLGVRLTLLRNRLCSQLH
jgi:hypothetical protein